VCPLKAVTSQMGLRHDEELSGLSARTRVKGGDIVVLKKCREYREKRGLSLMDLAVKSSCSIGTIQNAERGKGVVLNNCKAIAKALNVKLEDLVT